MLSLLKKHFTIIFYCFLVTLFAGYGQSFYIGQFINSIRQELGFTRTEISFLYSLATFVASFNLAYLGGLIDKMKVWYFALITIAIMVISLFWLSLSYQMISFFIGFYLLRGFGQIVLGLVASTQIAKLFGKNRGKAQTMSSWGRSVGEGLWPLVIGLLLVKYSWRETFQFMGVLIIIVLVPATWFLLRKFPKYCLYEENESVLRNRSDESKSWKWIDVLRDYKVVGLMVSFAILPFVATGIFFQQGSIVEAKGWSEKVIPLSFIFFSISHIFTSYFVGQFIDRYSSRKLLPFMLWPLTISVILLAFFDQAFIGPLSFSFLGIAVGMSSLTRNSFWAETFGTESIGRIKGMDSNILVVGTSIAPVFFAKLLDLGVTLRELMLILLVITFFGNVAFYAFNKIYKKSENL